MSQKISIFSVLALLALPSFNLAALAEGDDPLAALKGTIGTQAGLYEFFKYDKGLLQSKYIDILQQKSEADRDYFLKSVNQIETEFNAFIGETLYSTVEGERGLYILSQASQLNEKVPAAEFVKALNSYNQGILALQTKINTITSIASAFPSQDVTAGGSELKDIPQYGNINFSTITDFYTEKLGQLSQVLANLPHWILMPNGIGYPVAEGTGQGLKLPTVAQRLSGDQERVERDNVLQLRRWQAEAKKRVDTFTRFIVRDLIHSFISTYGSSERWRIQTEAQLAEREKKLQDVVVAFWARSYIRAIYGVSLGAIGTRYNKKIANLDMFLNSTEDLFNLIETPIWTEDEFMFAQQAYRLSLEVAGARATKILDGETDFLTKANSFLTYVGGKRPLAETLQMMLSLLAADLYEETLIRKPSGPREMMLRYQERYYSNEQDKKFYKSLEDSYDPDEDVNDSGLSDMAASKESLFGQFSIIKQESDIQASRLDQAKTLEANIAILTGKLESPTIKKQKDRKKQLDDIK